MQTTTVKLYSSGYGETRTYLAAALFIAGNIALPQLCHLARMGGPTWLRSISSRSSEPTNTAGASVC